MHRDVTFWMSRKASFCGQMKKERIVWKALTGLPAGFAINLAAMMDKYPCLIGREKMKKKLLTVVSYNLRS